MEMTIKSLSQYVEEISGRFSVINPNRLLEKDKVFFRGQSNKSYDLLPNLFRKVGNQSQDRFLRFESKMIDDVKIRCPNEFDSDILPISLLAKLQHYGIPTRMLDLTENALVALFFACCSSKNNDGKVYCFKVDENMLHSAFSFKANIVADSYEFSEYTLYKVSSFVSKIKHKEYFPKQYQNYDKLESEIIDLFMKPLFVIPEYKTERIKRQQGLFLIFPNKIENEYLIDEPVEVLPELYSEIIIPYSEKEKILEELKLFGITNCFLFPEFSNEVNSIKNEYERRLKYY